MRASRTEKLALAGIVALAAVLRLFLLGRIPPGFFMDEASVGYNAYSLLLTGRDIHGAFPLFFLRGLDVWSAGLSCLAEVPSIALIGLNPFGARFPAALAGVLTVPLAYLAVRLRSRPATALWAALLLAVAPWHYHLSRYQDNAFVPLFFMLGLSLFFLGLEGNRRFLYLGALAFGIGFYTYIPARIFIPLSFIGLLVIYRGEITRRGGRIAVLVLVFSALLVPALVFAIREPEHFFLRYRQTAVAAAAHSAGGAALAFLRNYAHHLSPVFLFLRGDANPRHFPQGFGQLYYFELPLIAAGFAACLRSLRRPDARFLLFWLLIAPVPASLTSDGVPHSMRMVCALPLFQVLSAVGIEALRAGGRALRGWKRVAARGAVAAFLGLAALNALAFLRHYYLAYPRDAAPAMDYGWGEALRYAKGVEGDYDRVFMTVLSIAQPTMYPPFYLAYPPDAYRRSRLEESKYRFLPPELMGAVPALSRGRALCIVRAEELPGAPARKTIFFPDGRIAFRIVEKAK